MTTSERPRQPRWFRHRGWRAALPLFTGLLLLFAVLVLSSRWVSIDWSAAVRRCAESPYSWLAVLVYLVRYLLGSDQQRPEGRWRNALAVVYWLLLALVLFAAVFAGTVFPDRWYGTVATVLLVILGSTFVADSAQRLLTPTDSGSTAARGRPR